VFVLFSAVRVVVPAERVALVLLRVLVDALRAGVAAGVRCVLVVPELRTRVVVVLVRCALLAGCAVAAEVREVLDCCVAEVREVLDCCVAEVREVLDCCVAEVREVLDCCVAEVREVLDCCVVEVREVLDCCVAEVREVPVVCCVEGVVRAATLLLLPLLLLRVLAELLRELAELLRVLVVVRVAPDCSTA